jgi:hypothetical protein
MRAPRYWLPFAGFATIGIVSAAMLLAACFNRLGSPESVLKLSEREVALSSDGVEQSENSALSLRLLWRVESPGSNAALTNAPSLQRVPWITRQKLEELKVALSRDVGSYTWASVLLVLELNGPAYERALAGSCAPAGATVDKEACGREEMQSRLYVVNAGRNLKDLRNMYPDRAHYAIVHGFLKIALDAATGEVAGYVDGLNIETIRCSESLRSNTESAAGDTLRRRILVKHSYNAVVAFGRRLEPWVLSME